MRTFVTTIAASVALSAGLAVAQYHPYGVPAALPAPSAASMVGYQPAQEAAPMPTPEAPAPIEGEMTYEHAPGGPVYQGGAPVGGLGGYGMGCQGCDTFAGYGCGCPIPNCWYGSVAGLIMTREDDDPVWLSFDVRDINTALLGTPDAAADWEGGFDVTLGRRFGCNQGVELNYWTLGEFEDWALIQDSGANINSSLDYRSLNFSSTDPVNTWFNNAQAQSIHRSSEFHNLELNLVHFGCGCPGGRLCLNVLGGFRWFRFKDGFLFGSSDNSVDFGVDPSGEAFHSIDVENDLLGFQIGARADYRATCRCSLWASTKVGIFHNDIEHESNIFNGDGVTAWRFADDRSANVRSSADQFATLAQVDLGVKYRVNCHLAAFAGYRLVAASGVASSVDQIPLLMDDLDGVSDIDTNGHLFLHGGIAGVDLTY